MTAQAVRWWVVALAAQSAPAAAQVWEELKGEDLHRAFESRMLEYDDGATQRFGADGRTVYRKPSAIDLSGLWWVDSNLLCFALEPGRAQECFKVKKNRQKLELKLEPEGGGTLKLRYRETE